MPIPFPFPRGTLLRLKNGGVLLGEVEVPCMMCLSENQRHLNGEMVIHFMGLENVNKPTLWVLPKLLVCLNCGFTEFSIPETELRRLVEIDSTDA